MCTHAGEPSALFQAFVRHEGVLLAGVFIAWLCKLGLDIYTDERFEEGQRKLQLERRHIAAREATLCKIRELQARERSTPPRMTPEGFNPRPLPRSRHPLSTLFPLSQRALVVLSLGWRTAGDHARLREGDAREPAAGRGPCERP